MRFRFRFFVSFGFALLPSKKRKSKTLFFDIFFCCTLETCNHSEIMVPHSKHKHLNFYLRSTGIEHLVAGRQVPYSIDWTFLILDLKCSKKKKPAQQEAACGRLGSHYKMEYILLFHFPVIAMNCWIKNANENKTSQKQIVKEKPFRPIFDNEDQK